jgi:hypothetical protein
MASEIDYVLQKILNHPYFDKLKKVKEVNAGHTEDSVLIHVTQTFEASRQAIQGDFITNAKTKKSFEDFMNLKTDGVPYKDIAVITALTHDVGKLLSYKEGSKIFPMNIHKPDSDHGTTYNPGHEYWGSLLIPEVLSKTGLTKKVIDYIQTVVRLHGNFFGIYQMLSSYSLTHAIRDMKSYMEGYHLEVLFNSYCDTTHNQPLQPCRRLIGKMFNESDTYLSRNYFVE